VFTDAIVDPKLKGKAQKVMLMCVLDGVYLMMVIRTVSIPPLNDPDFEWGEDYYGQAFTS